MLPVFLTIKRLETNDISLEDLENSLNDDLMKKNNVGWWGGHRRTSNSHSVSRVSKTHMHNQPISVRCGKK